MYLHDVADEDASFTKEDMQQGKHTEYERRLIEQTLFSTGTNVPITSALFSNNTTSQTSQSWTTNKKGGGGHVTNGAGSGGGGERHQRSTSGGYEAPPRHQRNRHKHNNKETTGGHRERSRSRQKDGSKTQQQGGSGSLSPPPTNNSLTQTNRSVGWVDVRINLSVLIYLDHATTDALTSIIKGNRFAEDGSNVGLKITASRTTAAVDKWTIAHGKAPITAA